MDGAKHKETWAYKDVGVRTWGGKSGFFCVVLSDLFRLEQLPIRCALLSHHFPYQLVVFPKFQEVI